MGGGMGGSLSLSLCCGDEVEVEQAGTHRYKTNHPPTHTHTPCPHPRTKTKQRAYADSKTLTEAQREALFAAVSSDPLLAYRHDSLSAASISSSMLGRAKVSLNELAAQSTLRLIQGALDAGARLSEVYVDTVGDPDRYRDRLSRAFPGVKFTVCPKADALYPVVSAASIVAKVTRDRALEAERGALPEGARPGAGGLGTGYPHDELTKAWLGAHVDPVFGFLPIVRFSWETAAR